MTIWGQGDATGPVWMVQALKPLCLIHIWSWMNSLWGNKSSSYQSMSVFRRGNIPSIQGLKRTFGKCFCKLNIVGKQSPFQFRILIKAGNDFARHLNVLRLKRSKRQITSRITVRWSFSRLGSPLWKGNSWKMFMPMGCKWFSMNGGGTETPLSHLYLELDEFTFHFISPLGLG